ncbi:MAG: ABC transporter ATP-binding protein [Chloroflexota bacterium]
MTYAIETKGLGKQYGDVTAVADLSLHVTQGEIYAFLGLNGAGKTTTIRMLLGMVKPTSGEAVVLGTAVRPGVVAPWASVGYLVETPHAYPELTVRQNLNALRRLRPGVPVEAVQETIEWLKLDEYADRRAGTLSLGNAQRLGLAKALLHRPDLLILDEPTSGLDPAGIVEIRRLLRSLVAERGVTIFMSSHMLGEVSRLADRIGIIHQGRLLRELDHSDLERDRRRWLAVQTRTTDTTLAFLSGNGYAASLAPDKTILLTGAQAVDRPDDVATELVRNGMPPTLLSVGQEDLEDYFLRLVSAEVEIVS